MCRISLIIAFMMASRTFAQEVVDPFPELAIIARWQNRTDDAKGRWAEAIKSEKVTSVIACRNAIIVAMYPIVNSSCDHLGSLLMARDAIDDAKSKAIVEVSLSMSRKAAISRLDVCISQMNLQLGEQRAPAVGQALAELRTQTQELRDMWQKIPPAPEPSP